MPLKSIGILALQGGFAAHREAFRRLDVETREVRKPSHLDGLDGLVLPGGESTAVALLLEASGMDAAIRARIEDANLKVFGTCMGAILLSKTIAGRPGQFRFGFMDLEVERNAYGRQNDSFECELELTGRWPGSNGKAPESFHGVFIRAPRFISLGSGVEVLARWKGDPVLVRNRNCLAASFHPELTDDPAVHRYFLEAMDA